MNRVPQEINRQIQVFGIQLDSRVDYRQLRDVTGDEEPCLKGYERRFDPLQVLIGYGFDGRIRKITTRNSATSIFRISPDMPAEEGKDLAQRAGLLEISPHKYRGKGITLMLLVNDKGRIFGITVETET